MNLLMKRIFLTRHGQSTGNVNHALYFEKFDCDIGLTLQGKVDAMKAGHKIMELSDSIYKNHLLYPELSEPVRYEVFHSPYLRAQETANEITATLLANEGHIVDDIHENPLLREREWGSLRDIVVHGMKTESHFNFYYRPDGGESFADAYQRAAVFYQWFLNTSKCENNIIVAHGEFNKLLLMHMLEWNVGEFEKWKTPRNGEVYLLNDKKLSISTPLTIKNKKS